MLESMGSVNHIGTKSIEKATRPKNNEYFIFLFKGYSLNYWVWHDARKTGQTQKGSKELLQKKSSKARRVTLGKKP